MIESTVNPRLAARQSEAEEMIRFKQQMNGLKDRLSSGKNREGQLKEACQNFEAVFISKLWQQMKQSVPKEGYLHSKQEESYMAMFDRDFAEKMAKAGGIGLADMIYGQLSQKLKEVSKETLPGGVKIRPMEAQPIPLSRGGKAIPINAESGGMTLEDWGGQETSEVSGAAKIVPSDSNTVVPAADARKRVGGMSDLEVQARLDSLVRRIEAERMGNNVAESDLLAEADG